MSMVAFRFKGWVVLTLAPLQENMEEEQELMHEATRALPTQWRACHCI